MRKSNQLFPIFRQGANDVLIAGMASFFFFFFKKKKKHKLIKWEGEREKARALQKIGVVKGNMSVVRNLRQFLLWFVLLFLGL